MEKIWYVTGASKGLGLALVKKLLAQNYRVAATSRNKKQLLEAVGTFDAKQFLPLEVALDDEQSIADSIQQTHQFFDGLDVVVNNAGYGIGGAVEELSTTAIRSSFEVNVFATISVMQAALPYFRQQRSGHIINIASIAGFAATTGWAIYAATKHAVIGLSEITALDVKEFGIHVTVVAPGTFRTDFLSSESLALTEQPIADYTEVRNSHARYATMDGTQLGDPEKAAEVFISLAEDPNPPVRLFMGSDSYRRALTKIQTLTNELEAFKTLSFVTDHKD
jgi:NAD(P)-dependent dehydrogenase (short-subunit alcohol dehydrogenase family)